MERTDVVSRRMVPIIPWWLVLLDGLAAILLGLMFLAAPGATTLLLVQILGWYWLISGVFSLVSMFIDSRQWGWKLISGIIGVLAGFTIIQHPLWSSLVVPVVFLTVLAIGGIIIGITRLFQAFSGAGLGIGLLGLLSIIFGGLILAFPMLGTITYLTVFPIAALVGGALVVMAALRMRGLERREVRPVYPTAPAAIPVTGEREQRLEEHREEIREEQNPEEPDDRIP